MPHIVVEYTQDDLNIAGLLQSLHAALGAQETIDLTRIKTRAVHVEGAIIGDGTAAKNMIHVTVKLLAGRPTALKKAIGLKLQETSQAFAPNTAITVEIVELDPATYCA